MEEKNMLSQIKASNLEKANDCIAYTEELKNDILELAQLVLNSTQFNLLNLNIKLIIVF